MTQPLWHRFMRLFVSELFKAVWDRALDALIILGGAAYAFGQGKLTISSLKSNLIDSVIPLIWALCAVAILHLGRTAHSLIGQISSETANAVPVRRTSPVLQADGRQLEYYEQPVIIRYHRVKIIALTVFLAIFPVLTIYLSWAHTNNAPKIASAPQASQQPYVEPTHHTSPPAQPHSRPSSMIRADIVEYQLPHLRSLIHQMSVSEMWISQILGRGKDAFYDVPGKGMIDYPAAVRVLANQGSITILETTTRRYVDFYGEIFSDDIRFRLSGGMYDDLTAKELGNRVVGLCNQINQFLINDEQYDAFSFMDGRDQAQQARTPEEQKKLWNQATRDKIAHANNAEIEFDEKFGFQITTLRSALLSRLSDTQKKSYQNNRAATDSDYQRPLWNSWSAKAVCQDLNQLAGMIVSTNFQNDADQSAQPTGVRVASQDNVQSPYPQFPHGLKVVLQTSVSIQPVSFAFECDGDIGQGVVTLGSDAVLRAYNSKVGLLSSRVFGVSFSFPAFTPDKPINLILYSKEPIKMTQWEAVPFSRP